MRRAEDSRYGILELVELTGVPRRTIRYYVQRELLPPPLGAGRGHYYAGEHLRRLRRIRDLQAQGLGLEEIRALLEGRTAPAGPSPAPDYEPATRIEVSPGVLVIVTHGARIPQPAQLRALAAAVRTILGPSEGEEP